MMLKRLLRTPALLCMLALLFAAILLAGSLTDAVGIPACGVVCGDDPIAATLTERLVADGLVLYESEDALRTALRRGEVAMGMLLPNGLTDRLARGKTSSLITFLEAPSAVLTPLYRYRAAAYLMEVYAPYLTSELLTDAGVSCTPADMQAAIDRYLASETAFSFTFTTVAGAAVHAEPFAKTWTRGAVALLLFFALPLFAVPYTERQFAPLRRRIGGKAALRAYALPQMLWVLLLFCAATASALLLSDALFANDVGAYVGAACIYAVFLAALGVLATALLGDTAPLRVPLLLLTLLSIGFCPILADLPTLLGIPAWPRLLLPPMFFYAAQAHPVPAALGAVTLYAAALGVYFRRNTKGSLA